MCQHSSKFILRPYAKAFLPRTCNSILDPNANIFKSLNIEFHECVAKSYEGVDTSYRIDMTYDEHFCSRVHNDSDYFMPNLTPIMNVLSTPEMSGVSINGDLDKIYLECDTCEINDCIFPTVYSNLTNLHLISDIRILEGSNMNTQNLPIDHSLKVLNVFATPFFPLKNSGNSKQIQVCKLNPDAQCFDYRSVSQISLNSNVESMKSTCQTGESFILPDTSYLIAEKSYVSNMIETVSGARKQVENNVAIENENDPKTKLQTLKSKNTDRPVIAHLNINSIEPKFEPLVSLIKDNVDLLMISETKVDGTFPADQFKIEGYSRPIRIDRNCHGGGLMIFTRDDLPCRELNSHKLPSEVECTFLEIRIRNSKWLVVGGYNPHKDKISSFLSHISKELDIYLSKYENVLLLGDWNSAVTEKYMKEFCETYRLENLIKEPTCYKSTENPSSIDIMLTNKKLSFQNSMTIETGLSDLKR